MLWNTINVEWILLPWDLSYIETGKGENTEEKYSYISIELSLTEDICNPAHSPPEF